MLSEAELKERLNKDMGQISWQELVSHIERGVVIELDASLDLIQTAVKFVQDDKQQVENWLQGGQIKKVEQAREGEVIAVVVAPWVLVQDKPVLHS